MGLPSKRRTKSSKRRRASHFAGTPLALVNCSNCGSAVRPHHLCMNCGAYAGTTLLKVASKAEKKLRKREKAKKKEEANAKAEAAA